MLEIGSGNLAGDKIIIDTAASNDMVPAECKLCQDVWSTRSTELYACQRVVRPDYSKDQSYFRISWTE